MIRRNAGDAFIRRRKKKIWLLLLSVFLVWGMTGMHGENVDAATETMEVLLNSEMTLYDNFSGNGTTHKEWYVSDTSKLSIVRTGNDGRYCVIKGIGLGDATVTCVTTYTIKVASPYGFTLETRYHRTVQNVSVVSSMPWKYIYNEPQYKNMSEITIKEGETQSVKLFTSSYIYSGKKSWSSTEDNVAKVFSRQNDGNDNWWTIQGLSEGTTILTCESRTTITDSSAKKKWINRTIYTIPVIVLKNDTPVVDSNGEENISSETGKQAPGQTTKENTGKQQDRKAEKKIKKIKLNTYKKKIKKKKKYRLRVTVLPKSIKKKAIIFKSSKPSVASVNKKGVIKAKRKGIAKITVRVKGSRKKAVCKVIVK